MKRFVFLLANALLIALPGCGGLYCGWYNPTPKSAAPTASTAKPATVTPAPVK